MENIHHRFMYLNTWSSLLVLLGENMKLSLPFGTVTQDKSFSPQNWDLVMIFYHNNKKETNKNRK